MAEVNASAVQMVNQRVSDLDGYTTVGEAVIYYPSGKYALDDAAKADLDKLAAIARTTDGYLIEIAGYASKTGTQSQNQQLSENRASAVANYLHISWEHPYAANCCACRLWIYPSGCHQYRPPGSGAQPACRGETYRKQGGCRAVIDSFKGTAE